MRKRSAVALIAALIVVAAGVFISFFLIFTNDSSNAYTITLPGQGSANIDPSPEIGDSNRNQLQTIQVDRTNIQDVIKSLHRPEQYHLKSETIYFYGDSWTTLKSQIWKNDSLTRIKQFSFDGSEQQQVLLSSNWVYVWDADHPVVRYTRRTNDADLYSRAPTYEDLLKMPKESILQGCVTELDGQLCLYVESLDNLTGETERWYILVENGLMVYAEGELNGAKTYQTQISDLLLELAGQNLFLLPDGTKPE